MPSKVLGQKMFSSLFGTSSYSAASSTEALLCFISGTQSRALCPYSVYSFFISAPFQKKKKTTSRCWLMVQYPLLPLGAVQSLLTESILYVETLLKSSGQTCCQSWTLQSSIVLPNFKTTTTAFVSRQKKAFRATCTIHLVSKVCLVLLFSSEEVSTWRNLLEWFQQHCVHLQHDVRKQRLYSVVFLVFYVIVPLRLDTLQIQNLVINVINKHSLRTDQQSAAKLHALRCRCTVVVWKKKKKCLLQLVL